MNQKRPGMAYKNIEVPKYKLEDLSRWNNNQNYS